MKTYGTAELKKTNGRFFWHVSAEAHVTIMAKRILTGASQNGSLKLQFSATDSNSRLLQWLMTLYPLDCSHQSELDAQVAQTQQQQAQLERIQHPDYVPRSFELAVPARDYQRLAVEHYLLRKSLLLGDVMGTGKTCSAITSLCDPGTRPALVVCHTHLLRQWKREINRFLPELKVHTIQGTKPYVLEARRLRDYRYGEADKPIDVLLTTYNRLHGWRDALHGRCKSIIFDEVQELRRDDSAKYRAATSLASACDYRLGLSATPIYGYGGEIYNVLSILEPGLLGTWEEFTQEWCRFVGRTNYAIKDPVAFHAWMKDQKIFLRRTLVDIRRELPPLSILTYPVDTDTKVLEDIQDHAQSLAETMLAEDNTPGIDRMQAYGEFEMLLRQATGIAKAPHVAAFVDMLLENEEPVVLFGWHIAVYEIWAKLLAHRNPQFYTGRQTPNQKEAALANFLDGTSNLLILSLRSGAGLDGLQHRCRTPVIGEMDWSPAVVRQCIGRVAERDGQVNPVTAYVLVSEAGSDPMMAETLGFKQEQSDSLLGIQRDVLETQVDTGKSLKKIARTYLEKRSLKHA